MAPRGGTHMPAPRISVCLILFSSLVACERQDDSARDDAKPPALATLERAPEDDTVPLTTPESLDSAASPEPVTEIPANPEPEAEPQYVRIGRPKPYPFGAIRRYEVRIRIGDGYSRDEVEAVLEQAARDTKAAVGGRAIDVLAFGTGDDVNGMATVGRGMLAPNGRWADADKPDPIRFSVLFLSDGYFQGVKEIRQWLPGNTVRLQDSHDEPIRLSNDRDRWSRDVEVASLLAGTEVTIAQRYVTPMGDGSDFIRYEVEVTVDGRVVHGWVHREAVEGPSGP